jgi:hypothetical protein
MFRLAHSDAYLRVRHLRYRVCALGFVLVLAAVTAPPMHASPRGALVRATGRAVFVGPVNPFTGLGHEGSGLLDSRQLAAHAMARSLNEFTGLGHEGSGLLDSRQLAAHATANSPNPFTGLGHEGGGLLQSRHLAAGVSVATTSRITPARAIRWVLGTFRAGHHV